MEVREEPRTDKGRLFWVLSITKAVAFSSMDQSAVIWNCSSHSDLLAL